MKAAEPSAPSLPVSREDLDAWQVYADQLTERGDRLGPYLAYELSLGAEPSEEQLTVFHKKALRICRVPRQFAATWVLGQVRGLTITRDRSKPVPWVSGDDLLTLRELLCTPQVRQLERLIVAAGGHSIRRRWESAMRQLPLLCRCFELHARSMDFDDAQAWLEGIPSQVEVLRLVPHYETSPASLVSDRLAWLDLRSVTLTPELSRSLESALRDTSRVKLRIGTVSRSSALARLGPRAVLGAPDDVALIEEAEDGAITLLERMSLEELQARYGIVTARAQLERGLLESYRLGKSSRGFGDTSSWTGDAIVFRTEGRWWIRATGAAESTPRFTLHGQTLSQGRTPLNDGDRLHLNGQPWRFVDHLH
jgi:hypothetical protein